MKKFLSVFIIFCFLVTNDTDYHFAYAQGISLPVPGAMVSMSPAFEPVLIKGLRVHPENPFLFDLIIDTGDTRMTAGDPRFDQESRKLIKYFLAAMTIPEKDLWVNLSPYEKDRIVPPSLGETGMGRDMLAEDYILKQLTASMIYPEKNLGKVFWDEVYAKTQRLYGAVQVPVNTFNKVWIIADKVDVYEKGQTAYVAGAHLKVMLEEDYLSLSKHLPIKRSKSDPHAIASRIIRQIILPQIEIEVNSGKNFAPLRQIFYSMILASWYKIALKDAVLTQIYGNSSKVKVGINQDDPRANEGIFQRYLKAYKKGVFNYIKEDLDLASGKTIPRKYFSGGLKIRVSGVLNRIMKLANLPVGDSVSSRGRIFDESIVLNTARKSAGSRDPAMNSRIEVTPDLLIALGYNYHNDTFIEDSPLIEAIPAMGNSIEIRRGFIQNISAIIGASDKRSDETELGHQVRILVEALYRLAYLEKVLRSRPMVSIDQIPVHDPEMKLYKLIQYEMLKQVEMVDSDLPVISNFKGNSFDVYHQVGAGYVKKELKIPESVRWMFKGKEISPEAAEVLWQQHWRFFYRNAKFLETRLERLAARVIQLNERTFYQVHRPPMREVMTELLSNLSRKAIVQFGKPLSELDDDQLALMEDYQTILKLIDAYCNLQKAMWSRGIIDTDPKILDNYGVYVNAKYDENPVRLIDFSHVGDQREDYWAEWNDYLGVMHFWNFQNTEDLDNLGEGFGLPGKLGEYYLKMAPRTDDFIKMWPSEQDPIHLAESRRQGPVIPKRLLSLYERMGSISEAMIVSSPVSRVGPAAIALHPLSAVNRNGGIDLTDARHKMSISKEGQGVHMTFDRAMIEAFKREDFDGMVFYVKSIVALSGLPV